jgi:hypothetical protein
MEAAPLLPGSTTRNGQRYLRVGGDTEQVDQFADDGMDITGFCSRKRFYAMVGTFFGLAVVALILTMSLKHYAGPDRHPQ